MRAVGELHGIGVDLDRLDPALAEHDPVVQLFVARLDDLVNPEKPERHEQQPRLVDVAIILVDHCDRHVVIGVAATQTVRDQRASGPRTEHHDPISHHPPRARVTGRPIPLRVRTGQEPE